MAVLTHSRNPIRWQELTHQERSAPRWTHGWSIVAVTLLIISVTGIFITLTSVERSNRDIALMVIWFTHAATVVRCIAAGANVISREHIGQTWDSLVLTGVSARQILLGKWWAALYRVRGWMLAFGVLRLTILPVFLLAFLNRFAFYRLGRSVGSAGIYSNAANNYYPVFDLEFLLGPAVLAVVMTVVLTLLEVLACTALGMACSAVARRGTLAASVAFIIRFMPVAIFAAFTRYEQGPNSWRWFRYTPFALADGGTAPLYQLVLPTTSYFREANSQAMPGLLMVAALSLILLVVSLAVTMIAIRYTGALPHPKEVA